MRTISSIRISGFRSIKRLHIDNLGDFTVLAGLNNSGKSNVLRALNLFFNGEVEPGRVLNLSEDFHAPDKQKKHKQQIKVDVSFTLPSQFKFRKNLESVQTLLGNKPFTIRKVWSFDTIEPAVFIDYGPAFFMNRSQQPLADKEALLIKQFLGLVHFRYIPNRILPVQIVQQESKNLQALLQRRMALTKKTPGMAFAELADVADKVFERAATNIAKRVPQIQQVALKTPTSLADVMLGFVLNVKDAGGELADEMQGSGLQSFLMLALLHLIDTDYGNSFGWRQSEIWAVEEPESSMHHSLERQTASYLREIAVSDTNRMQIISTTHSEAMMQFATTHCLVKKEGGATFAQMLSLTDLLDCGAKTGINRFVHPLLYYPHKPLLLVEGKFDERVISIALQFMGYRTSIEVVTLELLKEGEDSGGKDRIRKYLKDNMKFLKQRDSKCPVVVILDWEESKHKNEYEKQFSSVPVRWVAWNCSLSNPHLSDKFKGIERFHNDRVVKDAINRGAQISMLPNGDLTVNNEDYGQIKKIIDQVVSERFEIDDLTYIRDNVLEFVRKCGVETTLFE